MQHVTLTCKETPVHDATSGESRSKAPRLESASCAQRQQAAVRRTSWVRQGRRALFPACKLFRVKSRGLFVSVLPGLSTVLPATDPWSVFSVSQPTACTATLAGSGPPDALPIMTKEGWQTGPAALCWRQTLVSTGLTWILGPNPSTGEGAPACPQNATLTSGGTGGTEAPFVV